MQAPQSNHS